jgi:hypothetical protein
MKGFDGKVLTALVSSVVLAMGGIACGGEEADVTPQSTEQALTTQSTWYGWSKGSYLWPTYFGSKVPILSSFGFDFASGDHHIKKIGAELRESDRSAIVHYRDKNGDDLYNWHLKAALMESHTVFGKDTLWGTCKGDYCYRRLPYRPDPQYYAFVIQGFSVEYVDGDHHIHNVGVEEYNGYLLIHYGDGDANDEYRWSVSYAYVPRWYLSAVDEASGYNVKYSDQVQIPYGTVLLRGFRFSFPFSDNHHLDRLMVDTRTNGSLKVAYDDKNDDDRYHWYVKYATAY